MAALAGTSSLGASAPDKLRHSKHGGTVIGKEKPS